MKIRIKQPLYIYDISVTFAFVVWITFM
jgi:hypothetical protein